VANAQAAVRCGLLHARGDVDRGAADAALGIDAGTHQHAPSVDAGADVEVGDAAVAQHQRRVFVRRLDHRQPGAHREFGVVLARRLGTEGGEHAVAGVLQHAPVVGVDRGGEALERAVHHGVDLLGVQALADRGGAHDIDEQHRHLLELLARQVGLAQRAQAIELAQQRCQRRVDHRTAENRALRLERGDRGGDGGGGVGHQISVA
jgi:hypothetical protein